MTTTESQNKVWRPSVESLVNRGVDVDVWKTELQEVQDPLTGETVMVPRATNEKIPLNIKFTAEVFADLEDKYSNIETWNALLMKKPFKMVLDTLVVITHKPRSYVSEILVVDAIEEYQLAIQVAYLIGMGASREQLGKMIRPVLKMGWARDSIIEQAMNQAEQAVVAQEVIDTLGTNGSPSGSDSTSQSKTSGNQAQHKSNSSSIQTSDSTKSKKLKRSTDQASQPDKEPSGT